MQDIESIQALLERQAITLSNRIHKIYMALEELSNLSLLLFEMTPQDDVEIKKWLKKEEFAEDDKGFFRSVKSERAFNRQTISGTSLTYHWPASLKESASLQFLFFSHRNIGEQIERISKRLEDVSIIYFQDISNNSCLAFPYFDMGQVIPPDFNWETYHAYQSVKNRQSIHWTPPNIDYAGEGLISIASIPCYQEDHFVGLWSIDVPHLSIHKNCIVDTIIPRQINFISDFSGRLIAHPTIDTIIDTEKGSFYQGTCAEMSSDLRDLDFGQIISKEKGVLEINSCGNDVILIYQVVPEIEWILFSYIPKDILFHSVERKIKDAFEKMKKKNIAAAIDFSVGNEIQAMVDSYNDMITVLSHHQKKREEAQEKAYQAQRILTEELETIVQKRTRELETLNNRLTELAGTDPLTGIRNRRSFFEQTDAMVKLMKREGKPAGVLMLDIDCFKNINDTLGHQKGDEILVHFASAVSGLIRSSDIFARYGGEEFVLFLPNTEGKDAFHVADKIRTYVDKQSEFETGIHYTVSIGFSPLNENLEATLQKADHALYQAKRNGRNRVKVE